MYASYIAASFFFYPLPHFLLSLISSITAFLLYKLFSGTLYFIVKFLLYYGGMIYIILHPCVFLCVSS